jgi:hypothetical protein
LESLKGFGDVNEVGDSTTGATSVVVLSSVEERAPDVDVVERPFVIEMGGGTLMDLLDDLRRRREGRSSVSKEGLEEPVLVRWTSSPRRLPVDEACVNGGRFKGAGALLGAEGLEGLEIVLSDTDDGGFDGDLMGASFAACGSEALGKSFPATWGVSGWTSEPSPLRVPSSELFDQPERDEERGDGGMMVTTGWKLGAGEGLREVCSAPMALSRSSGCLWALLMTMLGTAVALVVVGAAILLRAGEGVRPRRRESKDRLELSLLCEGVWFDLTSFERNVGAII